MVEAKKFIFANRFEGMPKVDDFLLEEETLPLLQDGDVLVEAICFSVDPYMRPYSERIPIGVTMIGAQVAKVTESNHDDFPVGSHVYGAFGWRTHSIFNPNNVEDHFIAPYVLPPFGDLPLSLGLGNLGMTGNTAYFGLLDICKPQEDEVVVVSGAAGGVGSVVGQIAKIKGCKVIGIAGSDEKCSWIIEDLGFDHAINYKTENITELLQEYAPDGVDCYFDNVGGEISSAVINQMRRLERIAVCGSISSYNLHVLEYPKVPILQPAFIFKQLTMVGFIVHQYNDQWQDGIAEMKEWTDEGKLKYRETIYDGFEQMPQAFIDMLQGGTIGKTIVNV